jgi:8-oxo-dGTP diphosphatase
MATYNPDKMFRYVVGFMFDEEMKRVLLMLKDRPHWQKDKLNGIGGKIEESDPSPEKAMVRKFKEEVGIETTTEVWGLRLLFEDPRTRNELYVYTAKGPIDEAKQMESETPMIIDIPENKSFADVNVVSRLRWMLPMLIEEQYVGNLIGLVH